jgi:hypothetical protein
VTSLLNFFLPQISKNRIQLLRFTVGLGIFLHIITWIPYLEQFFMDSGFLTSDLVRNSSPVYNWSILFYLPSDFVVPLYLLLVSCVVCFAFSYAPQLFGVLTYILFNSFINRMPHIYYGGYQFLIFALFFLMLVPNKKNQSEYKDCWQFRVIQFQVCYIYLVAALMKIKEPMWLNGTQMQEVLVVYGAVWDFTWIYSYPLLGAVMTYAPMFLELSFAFLIWFNQTRAFMVASLILMHTGIMLTMNVTWLSETMICLLMSFLIPEVDFRSTISKVTKFLAMRKSC